MADIKFEISIVFNRGTLPQLIYDASYPMSMSWKTCRNLRSRSFI